MAKHWREPLDVGRHVDHFTVGGATPRWTMPGQWAYFVRVGGFTFELASLEQLRLCLDYFTTKIQPSSRKPVFGPETGHWQAWHDRLPPFIRKGTRRARVIAALQAALADWAAVPVIMRS